MSAYRYLRIEGDGSVRTVWLARADVRNAFNAELIVELTAALRALQAEADLRVLIVAADGPTFCAGADFHWMSGQKNASLEENLADAQRLFDMFRALYDFPAGTIGRVQGNAFGGGAGLVACCDLVVMAEEAQLAFSEVRIGLAPATISPFVMRKIGPGRARELFLTGMPVGARRALEIGLATAVVAPAVLDHAVQEYTEMLLRCGPEAVRASKRLVDGVAGKSLDEARAYTARLIAERRVSPEGQEGMAAFLEKRKPEWMK